MGASKSSKLPEAFNDAELANKFNTFFIDKIVKIRDSISNKPCSSPSAISEATELLFPGDGSSSNSLLELHQLLKMK